MAGITSFRDLKIWQKGMEIVEEIYLISRGFPKEEIYGLQSQIRRSAISIPSNIAEGFGRRSKKEYRQFLFVTRGSAVELETQIEIGLRLKIIANKDYEKIIEKIDHLNRMVMNLIKKL